ncbi:MAG: membrane dipeptidase, partial [Clostridia bacterium]|nr:membrane dipeptidase [Clostridia bacterium]
YMLAMHPGQKTVVTDEALKKGGVSLQTMAMFVGGKPEIEAIQRAFSAMEAVFARWKETRKQIVDPQDAKVGETAFMLSVEGCDLLQNGLETLAHWQAIGVRMAAITWNYKNALATPHCVDQTSGLTAFGREAVREMARLGIAPDVSHLNEAGFYDLLDMGICPLASHSCCRALCDNTRNLTDDQLRALFSAGGYVGVNFYPGFLKKRGHARINDVAEHLGHMLSLGGEGKIGFGSDFDGIERTPQGLEDPAGVPALLRELEKRFGQDITRGIAGENLLHFYQNHYPKNGGKAQ